MIIFNLVCILRNEAADILLLVWLNKIIYGNNVRNMLKYFSSVNDYENWKQVTINVIIITN